MSAPRHRLASALRVTVTSAAAAAMILAARTPARANLQPLSDGRARIGTSSWGDVLDPQRREARLLLRGGVRLLLRALTTEAAPSDGLEPPAQLDVERALERFDRALATLPDDPELAFYRGVTLALWAHEDAGGHVARRTEAARTELERCRALAPAYEPAAVAFQLAILASREHDYARVAEEYERARAGVRLSAVPSGASEISVEEHALYALFAPPDLALLALNQAEAEMLSGDLARARLHYEEALRPMEAGSLGSALALFGLALVEERSGSHLEALDTAARASRAWTPNADDTVEMALVAQYGPVAALHHSGVTFEPRWETFAYEALTHEALAEEARRARDEERAVAERARALRSLRAFFSLGGNESRFAETARAALGRAEQPIVIEGRVPARGRTRSR